MKNIHMHVMFNLYIVQEEAQAMIREADLNGDGRVDYKGKTFLVTSLFCESLMSDRFVHGNYMLAIIPS